MSRIAASAGAIVVAAALALLAAACGGSPSPADGSAAPRASATPASAVAYSECVRSHGIAGFPDPPKGGGVAKASAQQLGVSSSRLEVAETACGHLIPATGGPADQQEQQCFVARDCPPDVARRLMTIMLRFARCMRSHGVANFPDPAPIRRGSPSSTSARTVSRTAPRIRRRSRPGSTNASARSGTSRIPSAEADARESRPGVPAPVAVPAQVTAVPDRGDKHNE